MKFLFIFITLFFFKNCAYAGGQYKDQYCSIKTETITFKNEKTKSNQTVKEIVTCDDSKKDFLQESGIAKECYQVYFENFYKGKLVPNKAMFCKKLDGSTELVDGYEIRKGLNIK